MDWISEYLVGYWWSLLGDFFYASHDGEVFAFLPSVVDRFLSLSKALIGDELLDGKEAHHRVLKSILKAEWRGEWIPKLIKLIAQRMQSRKPHRKNN